MDMEDHATCNLPFSLSFPPWKESLQRDIYLTKHGERRTPFFAYVHPGPIPDPTQERSLDQFRFNNLPAELQFRILAFCPPNTLFQMMRVSSNIRSEASRLFWTQPDTYFVIEGQWLEHGAFPGHAYWDMAFLPYVENVEVIHRGNPRLGVGPQEPVETGHDPITTFWNNLTLRFPRAKKVLLNSHKESDSLEDHVNGFPMAPQLLLPACPRHIDASALVLERDHPPEGVYQRELKWRRWAYWLAKDGSFEKSEQETRRRTVSMAPKQFTGPVGEFYKLHHELYHKKMPQGFGIFALMVEAKERHHFDGGKHRPFRCVHDYCRGFHCDKPGEWTAHVAKEHGHDEILVQYVLPKGLSDEFSDRYVALREEAEGILTRFRGLMAAWQEQDGVKKRNMTHAFLEQLDNDEAWATGKPAMESSL